MGLRRASPHDDIEKQMLDLCAYKCRLSIGRSILVRLNNSFTVVGWWYLGHGHIDCNLISLIGPESFFNTRL